MRAWLAAAVVTVMGAGACGAARGAEDPRAVFDAANAAFREGASLRASDPAAAEARLAEAIRGYASLIEDAGIASPALYYNLGNAEMMRGHTGEAIVAYRRAERLGSADRNLRANLDYARSRVQTTFEAPEASRVERTLFGWQDLVPTRVRLGVFVGLFGAAWLVGVLRLVGAVGARARWVMAGLLVGSLLPGVSLAWTAVRESRPSGVVVEASAMGRKGPDPSYEPSFSRALAEGVEFELIEERPGWVYVRLSDGRATWLERGAVEVI